MGLLESRRAIRLTTDHRRRGGLPERQRIRELVSFVTLVFVSMRPKQWTKNLFVVAPLLFAQRLFTSDVFGAGAAFVLFCALSGVVYLFNDVADIDKDRQHPLKRA